MLSPVAGPISLSPQSPVIDGSDFEVSSQAAIWIDGWGLVCINGEGDHAGEAYVLKPSGKAARISGWRDWSGFGWDVVNRCLTASNSGGVTGGWWSATLPSLAPLFGPDALQLYDVDEAYGVLADRVIRNVSGSLIVASAHGADPGAGVTEYTYPGSPPGVGGLWYAGEVGGHHYWWVFTTSDPGVIWKYDSTAMAAVAGSETSIGSAFTAGGYSVKHGVFCIVKGAHPTQELWFYSAEPVAAEMTDPTLAGAVSRGGVQELAVVVTGSQGEPCPDRHVTFSVGAGSVDPATVATDADGVAATTFHAPLTAGPVTADAELVE